jgi:carbonic anhydrase/acetyltransferase-like protein (isoleucine patch superfamily)
VTTSDVHIGENVLVSQRAFLRNAWLGDGANAQENCFIINSRLEGLNVTAHGAKIIEADLGEKVFVGFNSFLRGRANERSNSRLSIGKGSVVMPHTIIDIEDDLRIPDDHLVWGVIKSGEDLAVNSMPIEEFERIDSGTSRGGLIFEGSGSAFIRSFSDRIHHILEANGAFFSGRQKGMGHAQKNRALSSTILHPYSDGDDEGLFPTTTVRY